MKNLLLKIILCIFYTTVLLFVGAVLLIISEFMLALRFYSFFTLTVTAVLIGLVVVNVFGLIKPTILTKLLKALLLACVVVIAGFEVTRFYHNSLEKVDDREVDLADYKPFSEGSRLARLKDAPTLTLTENLPNLDGATALYPLYAAFAQAVYPAGDYDVYALKHAEITEHKEVVCSTTPSAYSRLISGHADIIFAAAPSEQQLDEAKRRGVTLKLTPIGKEAFVFFVNAKNPVVGLDIQQIQKIYSGELQNWRQVGGKNAKIRAFQRPENSGSQTMLQKLMAEKSLMVPPQEDVAAGMGGIIARTASYTNYKNAIGYSFLYYATEMANNNGIKLLAIDGVAPTRENIANGTYPFTADFYAVTAGSENANVERLIAWILSEQGQYLVEKTGYTPLNP